LGTDAASAVTAADIGLRFGAGFASRDDFTIIVGGAAFFRPNFWAVPRTVLNPHPSRVAMVLTEWVGHRGR
jgi:hypothetical protein